ncbi:MAG: ABC transporter permease [Anaerolineae bacterium]|uniref:ABC transporter permease n=1 Tax=Candidatus Flexifilum breve TaxID=3140694 RepID=UPI001AC2C5B7|nr:ABC transporter permease [Chloroflexota bacterium]MBN8639283.1 ABC transporter permease [Anaerolineae bacterium]
MATLREPSTPGLTRPQAQSARANTSLNVLIRRFLLSNYFVLYLTVIFFVVAAIFFPSLRTPGNISNQLQNMFPLLAVAIGQTFVLILGGIDLSVGATMGLTSVIGAVLMAQTLDPAFFDKSPLWGTLMRPEGGILAGSDLAVPLGVLAMLIIGTAIGWLNGFAITRFNLAPFMVTLVTSTFFSAFALWLTQSRNISGLPDAFVNLGKGDLISIYFGAKLTSDIARRDILPFITYPFVIAVGLAIFAQFILSRTVFGRRMFSIGTNRRASEISGVPNRGVITRVYMFSGFCAAVASILYSGRLAIGQPSLGGGNLLLDIIGAAVIGGTSLFGGKGSVRGTFFGVAFFVLLLNILNAMQLSPFVIDAVKGLFILIAALLDITRTRLLNREARA